MSLKYYSELTEAKILEQIKIIKKQLKNWKTDDFYKQWKISVRYINLDELKEFEENSKELVNLVLLLKSLKSYPAEKR